MERYFNEIFLTFKEDKLDTNKKVKTSFQYSKFWAGFINLLCIFLEKGFSWIQIKEELKAIKTHLMKLQVIEDYNQPLFDPNNNHIPDAKYSPTKVCKFLNENRKQACSIQNIR